MPQEYLIVDSLENLKIDNTRILSLKKGDLNLIHTRTQVCTLYRDDRLLVLKEFDCLDSSIYNMKIHEANVMLNYRTHPNLINILSVWKSSATNSFSYKKIFMLFEYCQYGNLDDFVFSRFKTFPRKRILKYLTDVAKGLSFLHHNDCVHGGIKIKNLLINRRNDCVLGQVKKCELESMRKTRQLMSAFTLDRNIKDYFMYWAPELLMDQAITKASDIWAFGIVIFMLSTGQMPFIVGKKDSIFNAIVGGNIKWKLLERQPRVYSLLKNMLVLDPLKRWGADQVLKYFQGEMVIILQRFARRTKDKIFEVAKIRAVIKIQSFFRGMICRNKLKKKKEELRKIVESKIRRFVRNFQGARQYKKMKKAVMFLQAQVLARQLRRVFLRFKKDMITIQSFIRRRLGYNSYQCISMQRLGIVKDLAGVKGNFTDINKMASLYFSNFNNDPMQAMEENYAENLNRENETNPGQHQKTFNKFGEGNAIVVQKENSKLQEQLGPKYEEFQYT